MKKNILLTLATTLILACQSLSAAVSYGGSTPPNWPDTFTSYGFVARTGASNVCVIPGHPDMTDPQMDNTAYQKRAYLKYLVSNSYTNDGNSAMRLYTSSAPAMITGSTNLHTAASTTNLVCLASSNLCAVGDAVLIYDGWKGEYIFGVAQLWMSSTNAGTNAGFSAWTITNAWLQLNSASIVTNLAPNPTAYTGALRPGKNSRAWKLGLAGILPLNTIGANSFDLSGESILASPFPNRPLVLIAAGATTPLQGQDAVATNRITFASGVYK